MLPLLKEKKAELEQLCRQYDIKTMFVFGSSCTDQFTEESDVDFLISFKDISFEKYTDNYFELHEKLEALLGRKIDLVTDNSLTNPFFIENLEKTKQLLYAA